MAMKQTLSLIISLLLVAAILIGILSIIGLLFDVAILKSCSSVIIIGIAGALAGVLSPIAVALISRAFAKRK